MTKNRSKCPKVWKVFLPVLGINSLAATDEEQQILWCMMAEMAGKVRTQPRFQGIPWTSSQEHPSFNGKSGLWEAAGFLGGNFTWIALIMLPL